MHRLAPIALTIAAFAAVPAAAQTQTLVLGSAAQTLAADSTSCLRGVGSKLCSDYQEQLIRSVGRLAAARNRNISVDDLGRRQLDALVASIN